MQLVRKTVKGNSYWYLVQKGRKHGVVTNVKTIYLGTADRLAAMLSESGEAQFPTSFDSWEVGASAALCAELRELDVLRIIDEACPARRADATLSYGQMLAVIALQRAIAPRPLRSLEHLRQWYEGCGVRELLPMDPTGLDGRRVHDALALLRAGDLERLETDLVAAVVRKYHVSSEDWSVEKIVSSLREQSDVDFGFRQITDPQWASAVPLRHYTDSLLRVHTTLSVLALLLAKLVVRRLRRAGIQTTVSEALHELSNLRLAHLHYGASASPALKELARASRVSSKPSALQTKMIRALGITEALQFGPTQRRRAGKKTSEKSSIA